MKIAISWIFAMLVVVGCGSSTPDSEPGQDDPITPPANGQITFYGNVKEIVDTKCVACHQEGAIGGFSLTEPAVVQTLASFLVDEVSAGKMPPWPPANSCNAFSHDRSLSTDQKETLLNWLTSADKPIGDISDYDPTPVPEAENNIEFNVTLAMAEPYQPNTALDDDYRCFLVDWNQPETTYLTAIDFIPGRFDLVHHVVLYQAPAEEASVYQQMDEAAAGPGYTCFGGATDGNLSANYDLVGAWAPGTLPTAFPADTGIEMAPDTVLIMQMHYHPDSVSSGEGDLTTMRFRTEASVAKRAYQRFFTNQNWGAPGGMPIPAGEADVVHSYSIDISSHWFSGLPVTIYQVLPHMHELGTKISLNITKSSSENQCLIDIPEWDFDWQGNYAFVTPVQLRAGDTLDIECHWNNADHSGHHDEGEEHDPIDVEWGDGTNDEMCLSAIYFTVP